VTTWAAPGLEPLVRAFAARLAATPWPGPPAGCTALAPAREMRAVFAGTLAPGGPAVVAKWHRPVTWLDRLARRLTGGRGPREARVLASLVARGLPVPEPLGASDDAVDVLLTRRIEGLAPLPPVTAAPRALVEEVARLLARLHAAGLVHRDLTAANLALGRGGPVLVDLGGARLADGSSRRRALAHLAQAAHGLLHGASRSVRARGLRTWLTASGRPSSAWRAWAPDVERALVRRARRHHRRRELRAGRPGRHFALFGADGATGVRRVPETPAHWEQDAPRWHAGPLPGEQVLKAGGRVVRADLPGAGPCVVKRYAGVAHGRVPRPVKVFRRAVALEERGLDVARALLACAGPAGAGVLVSAHVDAPDLAALTAGGARRALASWPVTRRRACLEALGRSLRRLHDAEVSHRDLKPSNLLVVADPDGRFRFPLVDLEGVRTRYAAISWRRRARDLSRLAASLPLPPADRLRILAAYHRAGSRPPWTLRRLASTVHVHADAHRHRLRARYGADATLRPLVERVPEPNSRPPA
jgi:tRNA A-37 threonylcarbamoyl transferase component Bud32